MYIVHVISITSCHIIVLTILISNEKRIPNKLHPHTDRCLQLTYIGNNVTHAVGFTNVCRANFIIPTTAKFDVLFAVSTIPKYVRSKYCTPRFRDTYNYD